MLGSHSCAQCAVPSSLRRRNVTDRLTAQLIHNGSRYGFL